MGAASSQQQTADPDQVVEPLAGVIVVDLSTTMAGAWMTQFLGDAGATVLQVEPPGGSPLRHTAAWPAVARGKQSVELDLKQGGDRETLSELIIGADVFVSTFRPGTTARLGLTRDRLSALNPRLVSASITGWGSSGRWRDLKGYEGMVLAKLGFFHAKRMMQLRPGPAFVSVPFASWGAAQTALHGVLASLVERESSGLGQHVEADLVRGVSMLDTWDWFLKLVAVRWPEAFEPAEAFNERCEPSTPMVYPLLIAPTKDGHWLQFAQTQPKLFAAMLDEFGLSDLWSDPKWKGLPVLESAQLRTELWEMMIQKVGERTLDEWTQVMRSNSNISAELFRTGPGALEHPQMVHDGRAFVAQDRERGAVRQPSTLVHVHERPLRPPRSAPRLDEHPAVLPTSPRPRPEKVAVVPDEVGCPLAGVTIVEFGLMFAGPFASTMLADLGARVIKVESLEGDEIRRLVAFPEAGGARVMQGKESIALDLTTDEGRRVAHELVKRADVVLQAFRAGAAERAGVDHATLTALKPDLVYLNAPGYGTSGPYGGRAAYAPSVAAATGLALTDVPDAVGGTGSLDEIKRSAVRLFAGGTAAVVQADGIAALGAASAMLLGLLAKARGRPLGPLTTTMVGTATHALLDRTVDWAGRPQSPHVDAEGYGYSALYRIYRAVDGWIFLAAPQENEWSALVAAIGDQVVLSGDPRFVTSAARARHDDDLRAVLAEVFATRPAADWESLLTERDVGCVVVTETDPAALLQADDALTAEYCAVAVHPVFDEHPRIAPPIRFSRSTTQAPGGCLAGQHTDAILRELGYDDDAVSDLRTRQVVGGDR